MKGRLLQRTRSVSAARMTVRSHVPLGWKVAFGCIAFGVAIAAGVGLGRTGAVRGLLGDPNLDTGRLVAENRALQRDLRAERDRAREIGGEVDSRRVMEGSTIQELGEQIVRLEADNARLKEDVAFFEAATADRTAAGARKSGGEAGGEIAIRRFQVMKDPASQVARYRILLTQDSRASREFAGTLQLALSIVQAGRATTLLLPDDPGSAPATVAVAFKSYKRIDGTFTWPADSVLRSVQARVLERGAVRAQQTVTVD